ncbi:MAG: enoyl-CoA hydratase/isomerase family protein, partial [Parafilimonas terrae]|nr:enoyl-CoA hydratase/isomerase family protein [Parafilimonas terrae]
MPVSLERRGAVALILIDNPPVNAANHAVRAGIVERLAEAEADPAVRAVVLACAGSTFVAGADIREFGKPAQEPFLTEVAQRIEGSSKPVVAALHGTALGGGFELALACHHRVGTDDPSVIWSLAETGMGIIPGGGGVVRVTRLTGIAATVLDIIGPGTVFHPASALAAGLV